MVNEIYDVTYHEDDTEPEVRAIALEDGLIKPLTNATGVTFQMVREGAEGFDTPLVNAAGTIVDPDNGLMQYDLQANDLQPGVYSARFRVTWTGGEQTSYPGERWLRVRVLPAIA